VFDACRSPCRPSEQVPLLALVGLKLADARKTKREAVLARAALHDAGGGAPPQKGCCRKRGQVQVGQARVVVVKPRGDSAEAAAELDTAGALPVVAADMLRALRKAFAAFDWSVDRVEGGRAAAVSGLRRGAAPAKPVQVVQAGAGEEQAVEPVAVRGGPCCHAAMPLSRLYRRFI
jgi:hypothetical protein